MFFPYVIETVFVSRSFPSLSEHMLLLSFGGSIGYTLPGRYTLVIARSRSFDVDRAALLDVIRHVGDMDQQREAPVRFDAQRNRVVVILGVFGIDGERDGMLVKNAPEPIPSSGMSSGTVSASASAASGNSSFT